jgi:hypothetical protein
MRQFSILAGMALVVMATSAETQAAVCDLTVDGSSCTVNGAIYSTAIPQPTGTGFIDPFLRLQRTGTESGYNTSADYKPGSNAQDFQFDQKNPSFNGDPLVTDDFLGYTRDLALTEVPIVTINGTAYREFWLDINEPNGDKADISLDKLQIFLSPTAGLGVEGVSAYNTMTGKLAGLTAIYDLDAGTNNWIHLNYDLGNGSGSGDMVVYIPNSLFVGGSYVYLYSKFGSNYGSADGFEEWWVREQTTHTTGGVGVPEPASLLLLGAGLVLAGRRFRRRLV